MLGFPKLQFQNKCLNSLIGDKSHGNLACNGGNLLNEYKYQTTLGNHLSNKTTQ
jgi:hypothetical protein